MQIDWITTPITRYALPGLGLIGLPALWMAARFALRAVRAEISTVRGALETNVRELSESVNRLRADRESEPAPTSSVPGPGLNLTKRAQVVRMHRRGERIPSIAAALQTPRNEVELILKMERLLNPGTQ